ncbi:hypothetical protein PCL_07395 [Purpureocillium lilacinum]|uniref:Uncharacterized protein n=1 Tax=Purpureocillium lilacinum TaxID=33203 RepID=A0A2U3DS66_PURLI|nr:hypothetical protein PCL_07395 [Purpureocillium lilacinum]
MRARLVGFWFVRRRRTSGPMDNADPEFLTSISWIRNEFKYTNRDLLSWGWWSAPPRVLQQSFGVNPVPDALARSGTPGLVTTGSATPRLVRAHIWWLDTVRQGVFARCDTSRQHLQHPRHAGAGANRVCEWHSTRDRVRGKLCVRRRETVTVKDGHETGCKQGLEGGRHTQQPALDSYGRGVQD